MRENSPMNHLDGRYGPFGTSDPFAAPSAEEEIRGIVQNAVATMVRTGDLKGEQKATPSKAGVSCEMTPGDDPHNGSADLLIRRGNALKYSILGQMSEDGSRYNGKYKVFAHRSNADDHGTELDLSSPDSSAAVADLLECLRTLRFTK